MYRASLSFPLFTHLLLLLCLQDIQALLWKYFSAIELKIIRIEVIRMILKKRKNCAKNDHCQMERPLIVDGEKTVSSNDEYFFISSSFSWIDQLQ